MYEIHSDGRLHLQNKALGAGVIPVKKSHISQLNTFKRNKDKYGYIMTFGRCLAVLQWNTSRGLRYITVDMACCLTSGTCQETKGHQLGCVCLAMTGFGTSIKSCKNNVLDAGKSCTADCTKDQSVLLHSLSTTNNSPLPPT